MGMDVFDLQGSITLDTSDFEKSIKASVDAVKQVTTAVSSSNGSITAMQAEFEKQTKEIEAATNAEKQFNAELEKANHAFDDVSDGASDLSSETAELTTKLNATTAEFKKSKTETEELRKKLSEVSAASGETSEEAQQLAQQLEKSEKKTQSLESKMHKLETELESTSKSTDKAKNSTSEFDVELEKAGKGTEEFGKSVSDTSKKTDKATDSVSEMASKLATLKTRIEIASSAYAESEKQVEQLRKELDRAAKESGVNAEETRRLANEYEKAEKEAKSLESKLDGLNAEYEQERNAADKAGKETDEYGDSAEEAADDTKKLDKEADKLGGTLGGLVTKLGAVAGAIKTGLVTAVKIGVGAVTAASTAVVGLTSKSVSMFGEYEQLAGGAQKIFDEMDYRQIAKDAANAYKDLNLSASRYLESINLAGATFAQTMGDKKGYETARTGMLAIADYASGTGKNIEELNTKFQMITRATSSYQSIADQFSGILPATSADFLEQAQAAGFLAEEYTKLTDVPVAEYQEAVTKMLEKGVADLGLSNNTAREATETLTGSIAMTKAAWENLITGFSNPDADLGLLISNFVESAEASFKNIIPTVEQALTGISDFITGIAPIISEKLPELVNKLTPSILTAATAILDNLGKAIQSILPNLISTIFDQLPNLLDTGASIISSLLSAIQGGLSSIAENLHDENTRKRIAESAKELFSGLIDGISNVTDILVSMLPDVINLAGDVLINSLPKLLESTSEIIITLSKGILDSSDEILTVISSLISVVSDFLTASLPDLIPAVFELVYGLIEVLSSSDIFSQLTLAIIPILTAIADGLLKAAPIVYDKLPKIIENIFNTITTHMNEHGDEWVEQIETLVATLVNGVIELTPLFLEGIAHIVESLVVGVGEYIPALIDRIKSFFGIESFTESGNNIINGISNALSNGVEIVKEKAKAIFDGVIEWIEQLPERVGYFFTYTLGTIIQWAIDAPETAKTAASNLYDGIVEWVKQVPDMVKNFLTETLPKVVEWGLDLREKGLSAAKDLVNAIVTKVRELPDKMLEIGGNIVAGIWDGITNAKQWLNDRITGFCDGLVNGFKDSLGIHSPSTLMRDEIGKYLAQGIGVGFNDEMPDVVNDMTNTLQSGIDSEMKNVNGFDIDAEYSITMLDIKGIQDMVNELTKAKNLDINAEYEPPKNQLDDELESVIKARYELENSLPDDITEDLRKTVDVVYNMPNMPEIPKLAAQDVDIKYVPTNMPKIPKQLEAIARVEQVPDINRYEAPESIRQAPQSATEKQIVYNTFNISLALEGVKIASEIDVDEMTDEAVEKLSEKLEYLDVFGARSRGGSATV